MLVVDERVCTMTKNVHLLSSINAKIRSRSLQEPLAAHLLYYSIFSGTYWLRGLVLTLVLLKRYISSIMAQVHLPATGILPCYSVIYERNSIIKLRQVRYIICRGT